MKRRTHRRVTARRRYPHSRFFTMRYYVDGRPVARGYVGPRRCAWTMLYDTPELFDVDDDGELVKLGWVL